MMNLNSNDEDTLLHCFICYRKVRRARMCPHCSKLGCYDCLKTWSDKDERCPNCRQYVSLQGYADCDRFIEQLREKLPSLEQTRSKKDTCTIHRLKLRYFCEQCQTPFCPDCSAFSETHKGHKVRLMSEIYQTHKDKIQQQMTKFDSKIEEISCRGLAIKMDLQKLAQINIQKREFIQNYIYNMLRQLQAECKQKESVILSRFQTNQEEIELLDNIKETILGDLEDYSQNEVISRTEEILHLIKSLCERGIEELEIDTNFSTIHELVPEYQCFTYTLAGFSKLSEPILYSPVYSYNGCGWRLKIYPKGNGVAKGKFVSVFLQMSKGLSNKVKYQYKIQLINHLENQDPMPREYSSEFDIGECWGYNQFIEIKSLSEMGFLAEDELIFRFYVRSPTYRDMSLQQRKYISTMQNKVKELQRSPIQKQTGVSVQSQSRIKELFDQIASKRHEARNQLMMNNSIEVQTANIKAARMEQKEQSADWQHI